MSVQNDFLAIFRADYAAYSKLAKSFLKNYSKLLDIYHTVFHWIPVEFFILLFLSVLLLIMFNSVSPFTRKVNLIFSVLFIAAGMAILNKITIGRFRAITIGKASLFLIIPIYFYYFLGVFSAFIARFVRKRKLGNPGSIERALFNLQMTYNEAMAQAHQLLSDGNYDAARLKEKIQYLKNASDGLLNSLEKSPGSSQDPNNP
ncbi:MAG: hypothetical protein H7A25_05530 [Leptospiraceae bacterium]|nr:hypothetical protein [Leptospiraceae bacterium]MCP5499342.1 hypothetical protein [Leptospiraceae bacterium]